MSNGNKGDRRDIVPFLLQLLDDPVGRLRAVPLGHSGAQCVPVLSTWDAVGHGFACLLRVEPLPWL